MDIYFGIFTFIIGLLLCIILKLLNELKLIKKQYKILANSLYGKRAGFSRVYKQPTGNKKDVIVGGASYKCKKFNNDSFVMGAKKYNYQINKYETLDYTNDDNKKEI